MHTQHKTIAEALLLTRMWVDPSWTLRMPTSYFLDMHVPVLGYSASTDGALNIVFAFIPETDEYKDIRQSLVMFSDMDRDDFITLFSNAGVNFKQVNARIYAVPNEVKQQSTTPADVEHKSPSVLERATNFRSAMADWVKDGFKLVPQTEFNRRVSICEQCPSWNKDGFGGTGECTECGCSKAKHWLAISECPLKKWSVYGDNAPVALNSLKFIDAIDKVEQALGESSQTSKVTAAYRKAASSAGGCAGCKRKRLLRWIDNELRQLPEAERVVIDRILN